MPERVTFYLTKNKIKFIFFPMKMNVKIHKSDKINGKISDLKLGYFISLLFLLS